MRRLLLSWYGITDIRSAMGFEYQGPILGALKTERFDELHMLAYTKKSHFTDDEIVSQMQAIDELSRFVSDKKNIPREESWKYVDILANTTAGHAFYIDWLKRQLNDLSINVKIVLHECFLSELNDTSGIYFSAVEALNSASKIPDDEITFFLSPGTPVMAFSWALAMMESPKRSIKLLASPDFRKGVQAVDLPESVLTHIEHWRSLRHE